MTLLFKDGPLKEHHNYPKGIDFTEEAYPNANQWKPMLFKGDKDKKCVELVSNWGGSRTLHTSYYVGTDWLEKDRLAIYIEPKLNDAINQTDYFKMLFEGLTTVSSADDFSNLFEIKFEEPQITLTNHKDILTPLLIFQFLKITKIIVSKGLKKSYYPIVENLNSRIKGKIKIAQNIKQNDVKNRLLKTVCEYNEFGVNNIENKILKKALSYARRYLDYAQLKEYSSNFESIFNYISPAFQNVSNDADVNEIKNPKYNPFFKEYKEGLRLAKMLIQRYGYNINTINPTEASVMVPPFWIDMSKLFELYVLSFLRKEPFGKFITFQPQGKYGKPDFILCDPNYKIIIDAKYKPKYVDEYLIEDVRQLSGYARDTGILALLGINEKNQQNTVIDCVIIYPDQKANWQGNLSIDNLIKNKIDQFIRFYKTSVALPTLKY